MKKLFLAPALAMLIFSSCNDDEDLAAPEISPIEFSKEKIAVGQAIILSAIVTDNDTDTANLTYEWKSTDGFSSAKKEPVWVPTATGNKVITLTVDDGNSKTTQEATVDVVLPDFRLGLWGDTQQDIILSEENAGNEAEIPEEGVIIYLGDEDRSIDAYFLEGNKLIQAARLYYPEYTAPEYNKFVTDYKAKKASLTTTYGAPDEDITEWATVDAEATYANQPDKWGQAIAAGDLALISIWEITKTTAIALLLQEDGEGGIIYALVYIPIEEGGRYASQLQKESDPFRAQKYQKQIKESQLIKK